jgi:hypothetical protein
VSIPEGTILKVAQNILLPDTQTAVNVYWAVLAEDGGSGPLEEEDILEAAANWMDDLYSEIVDNIANTVIGTLVEVWEVNPADGDLTPIGDEATTWVGAHTGDALPNGVASINAMKTSNTDVTGRKFIPGIGEINATDNDLTSGALARSVLYAVAWATQFIDANSVTFTPGVWSMTKLNFFLATGTVIANAILGYQRRRKPGVGT